jgi:hypothetical protein
MASDSYSDDYHGPVIDSESDGVVVIYGDEYAGLAASLGGLMSAAATELGLTVGWDDYN